MKQIRLSMGLYTLVNDEDYDWLMQWGWCASLESRGSKWYAVRKETINGKRVKIRMHRAIVEHRGVVIPPGHVVDHANHNSLDNRFTIRECIEENGTDKYYEVPQLEVVTQTENMKRSPGWKKKGTKL